MLDIKNISVSYGRSEVLKEISIHVSKGEIIALVGPNGAGKTTLIKAVSGLVNPISGKIMVNGENIADLNEPNRAKQISVVPQAHQLGGAFSVAHTVMLGRSVHMGWLGVPSEKDKQRVQWALREIDIEHLVDRRVAELSGGEQQLVLLARSLAQETPVLLLDEPTNHLDLKHKSDLLLLVKRLAKQEGLAMLMAIHDLNLVSLFADRVALIVDGELLHHGKPGEVLTPTYISEAYQTNVDVFYHPEKGYPVIMPQRSE